MLDVQIDNMLVSDISIIRKKYREYKGNHLYISHLKSTHTSFLFTSKNVLMFPNTFESKRYCARE